MTNKPKVSAATIALTAALVGVFVGGYIEKHSENVNGRTVETRPVSADSVTYTGPVAQRGKSALVGEVGAQANPGSPERSEFETRPDTVPTQAPRPQALRMPTPVIDEGPLHSPHTRLQCADPRVAEWLTVWEVWQLYCMDGATERRLDGAWPKPVDWKWDAPVDTSALTHSLAAVESVRLRPAVPVRLASSLPLEWRQAEAGDRYWPRVYRDPYGWGPSYELATPGLWYLVYSGGMTHVTLLGCDDDRVLDAIVAGRPNVFCETADGGVALMNADPARMTVTQVFGDHDKLGRGEHDEQR